MFMKSGVVIKDKKGLYTVSVDGNSVLCHAGSRIRKCGGRLLAGDRVEIELNSDGTGFITAILPRVNSLVRPLVANIDVFVIVVASASPIPYLYNIDKLTAMAQYREIETALVINKCDIKGAEELLDIYETAGYKCFSVSAQTGSGLELLYTYLHGRTAVFAGASGVGKSSLLNSLYPNIKAETGELSKKISRGKNTTRHTEFFSVGNNTYIADTPGFTMLDEDRLGIDDESELFDCFPEFAEHFGSCRFRGCTHLKEEGCAVLEAVNEGKVAKSRHESYVKLYQELSAINKYS